ncbi:hypothetical protein L226DRAFT_307606 [Lentinus tigrinus ALCF2SS1-7]|uniref:uncharacterized protein n=1 Tax=Lentinus tigrinus ALCF2SS1-7 TaxID=1328758 RepID=UPI0011660855|nr:hypothetical protein L226DRAFT_307606 [Lentinus tigrinus ALCF2SS1-7]
MTTSRPCVQRARAERSPPRLPPTSWDCDIRSCTVVSQTSPRTNEQTRTGSYQRVRSPSLGPWYPEQTSHTKVSVSSDCPRTQKGVRADAASMSDSTRAVEHSLSHSQSEGRKQHTHPGEVFVDGGGGLDTSTHLGRRTLYPAPSSTPDRTHHRHLAHFLPRTRVLNRGPNHTDTQIALNLITPKLGRTHTSEGADAWSGRT